MSKPFNVRVYALLVDQGKLMVINEPFQGKLIYKLPGGGLEFGEGTKDCLIREFKEELNLNVKVEEHLYTQDFFQENAFNPNEQIILIYYKVSVTTEDLNNLKVLDPDIKEIVWIPLNELNSDLFTLATDKLVINKLKIINFDS